MVVGVEGKRIASRIFLASLFKARIEGLEELRFPNWMVQVGEEKRRETLQVSKSPFADGNLEFINGTFLETGPFNVIFWELLFPFDSIVCKPPEALPKAACHHRTMLL